MVVEKFIIGGGVPLQGEVGISGAKNAAVAILPATILAADCCVIENLPDISDVTTCLAMLQDLGAVVKRITRCSYEIDTTHINKTTVLDSLARKMRASYYFLGSILGRFGEACVPMPGGCDLGQRPVDQHLKAFASLGATDRVDYGMINVQAAKLEGSHVFFDTVSVGATINAMLAAVMANGKTVLENVAKEPHVVDVANFLNTMGADVRGAGTDVIKIRGVKNMHGGTYSIIPDQIEAGTYMVMSAITGGNILVRNVIPKHLEPITAKLERAGAIIDEYDEAVRVTRPGTLTAVNIKTMPHPGFPTDMQPITAALLSLAEGTSLVTEGIFENRFRYVDELLRMGANIQVEGSTAVIEGVSKLKAAPTKAWDLRAGVAMVLSALAAEGTSEVENIAHIERGYECIVEKISALGADIKRIAIPDNILGKVR